MTDIYFFCILIDILFLTCKIKNNKIEKVRKFMKC